MSILEVKDLCASYSSSGPEILKGISFDVAENDFLAIIGPSGAGKSTVIQVSVTDEAMRGRFSILHGNARLREPDTNKE